VTNFIFYSFSNTLFVEADIERLHSRRLLVHLGDRIAHRCVGNLEQSGEGLI